MSKAMIVMHQIRKIWKEEKLDDTMSWSLGDVIKVFAMFYTEYEEHFGIKHPFLTNETISRIIKAIPQISDVDTEFDLDVTDYPALIKQYFSTRFSNCDYSISHFMSGDIRLMRYYEVLY